MLPICEAGISLRISSSTRSNRRAVSSIRIPVGARTCRMNWPLSVLGKKSSPKKRQQGEGHNAQAEERGYKRTPVHHQRLQQRVIPTPETFETSLETTLKTGEQSFAVALCSFARSRYMASVGTSVRLNRYSWQAWRTPLPQRAAQRGSAPLRRGKTWAGRLCRCRASKPGPALRFARIPQGWPRAARSLAQGSAHVFNRDGGIIDQNPHGQRQAAKRHGVDRLADQPRAR